MRVIGVGFVIVGAVTVVFALLADKPRAFNGIIFDWQVFTQPYSFRVFSFATRLPDIQSSSVPGILIGDEYSDSRELLVYCSHG